MEIKTKALHKENSINGKRCAMYLFYAFNSTLPFVAPVDECYLEVFRFYPILLK